VPDLFEKVNVLSNPRAIKWEIRFVKYMVRRFKSHPAIAAWDLGNECNCMGGVDGADGAYLWVSAITDAIKTEDTSRPVISGMHGTFPEKQFRPEDLGEILDVLCTHPYPLFTPHCMTDAVMENKSCLHAVAETVL
jgi:endo-1,4-beta-mannosidase